MSNTLRYALPLLDAAQAQKHVTVNEALTRTDTLAAGRVESRSLDTPPVNPLDGEAYIVGPGATDAWADQAGQIALYLNGGWDFVAPWAGCGVWIRDEGCRATYTGANWISGFSAGSISGAATMLRVAETDHSLDASTTSTAAAAIPDKAMVIGVTARVTEAITGATSWSLGVEGGIDRYGSGYGTALNAFAHGVSGTPLAYYGGTALVLTADGGDFSGGRLLLAVHYIDLTPPEPIV